MSILSIYCFHVSVIYYYYNVIYYYYKLLRTLKYSFFQLCYYLLLYKHQRLLSPISNILQKKTLTVPVNYLKYCMIITKTETLLKQRN